MGKKQRIKVQKQKEKTEKASEDNAGVNSSSTQHQPLQDTHRQAEGRRNLQAYLTAPVDGHAPPVAGPSSAARPSACTAPTTNSHANPLTPPTHPPSQPRRRRQPTSSFALPSWPPTSASLSQHIFGPKRIHRTVSMYPNPPLALEDSNLYNEIVQEYFERVSSHPQLGTTHYVRPDLLEVGLTMSVCVSSCDGEVAARVDAGAEVSENNGKGNGKGKEKEKEKENIQEDAQPSYPATKHSVKGKGEEKATEQAQEATQPPPPLFPPTTSDTAIAGPSNLPQLSTSTFTARPISVETTQLDINVRTARSWLSDEGAKLIQEHGPLPRGFMLEYFMEVAFARPRGFGEWVLAWAAALEMTRLRDMQVRWRAGADEGAEVGVAAAAPGGEVQPQMGADSAEGAPLPLPLVAPVEASSISGNDADSSTATVIPNGNPGAVAAEKLISIAEYLARAPEEEDDEEEDDDDSARQHSDVENANANTNDTSRLVWRQPQPQITIEESEDLGLYDEPSPPLQPTRLIAGQDGTDPAVIGEVVLVQTEAHRSSEPEEEHGLALGPPVDTSTASALASNTVSPEPYTHPHPQEQQGEGERQHQPQFQTQHEFEISSNPMPLINAQSSDSTNAERDALLTRVGEGLENLRENMKWLQTGVRSGMWHGGDDGDYDGSEREGAGDN